MPSTKMTHTFENEHRQSLAGEFLFAFPAGVEVDRCYAYLGSKPYAGEILGSEAAVKKWRGAGHPAWWGELTGSLLVVSLPGGASGRPNSRAYLRACAW